MVRCVRTRFGGEVYLPPYPPSSLAPPPPIVKIHVKIRRFELKVRKNPNPEGGLITTTRTKIHVFFEVFSICIGEGTVFHEVFSI